MRTEFVLPWPPTVNTTGVVVAAHILYLRRESAIAGCGAYCSPAAVETKPVRKAGIKVIAKPPDKRRRDLDNILKRPWMR